MAKTFWAVMVAHEWSTAKLSGIPLRSPPEGPQRFIPVFDTREQAVAFAGSDKHVVEVREIPTVAKATM